MTELSARQAPGTTEYELPNGRRIRCVSMAEAMVLWKEATQDGLYHSASLSLRPGGTVLDIGANIGVVSLMFGLKVADLRIISVEAAPIPFSCLEANLRRHLRRAVALQAAVCERSGTRTFTYYPRSTGNSGLFADREADDETTRVFLRNSGIGEEFIAEMVRDLHEGVELTVPAVTVSDLVRRYRLARIDLLKVDVERAEALVLAGIEEPHWPLIDHIIAEVHDEGGRLQSMVALVEGYGFRAGVTQDPKLVGTNLYNLDARRS